jgi:hypothetical protein
VVRVGLAIGASSPACFGKHRVHAPSLADWWLPSSRRMGRLHLSKHLSIPLVSPSVSSLRPSHLAVPLVSPSPSSLHPSHLSVPLVSPSLSSLRPSRLSVPLISPSLSSFRPSHLASLSSLCPPHLSVSHLSIPLISPSLSSLRPFKDSDGGFRRAYGQMGPFLGAQTNLGLEQREGEKRT